MLYRYISSKAIVDRVMSRFGINYISQDDAIEWIGDALGLIGTHMNFVNYIDKVEVDFHKIQKPKDLYQLNFIVHNGKKLTHGTKKLYDVGVHSNATYGGDSPYVVDLIQNIFVREGLAEAICNTDPCDQAKAEDLLNKQDILDKNISSLVSFVDTDTNCYGEHWYNDSVDCYNTSIQEGEVYICYKAYPVDKEGYPLIIDEVKLKVALDWYVVKCLFDSGWDHKHLNYMNVLTLWEKARNVAEVEHLKMTFEEGETFVANWTNMYFTLREDNMNYFSN